MKRAIKIENGHYQMEINGQTYTINKGGNMNPGWWISSEQNNCIARGKSKFNCEVFLNYNNPALLSADVSRFRYL